MYLYVGFFFKTNLVDLCVLSFRPEARGDARGADGEWGETEHWLRSLPSKTSMETIQIQHVI